MQTTVTFWLPFPPSVNRIWRYARGKAHRSQEYVNWIEQANASGQLQKVGRYPVLGDYVISIQLSDAFRRFGPDVDNHIKCVADWCQRARLIVNDRQCLKASVEWSGVIEHDCHVTLAGVVAFVDQWEFARHNAEMARKKRTASRPRKANKAFSY